MLDGRVIVLLKILLVGKISGQSITDDPTLTTIYPETTTMPILAPTTQTTTAGLTTLPSTTGFGYICGNEVNNINSLNNNAILFPTDKGFYLPGQNCSWQIFISYPSNQYALKINLFRFLYGNDSLIVTNCQNNAVSLIGDYQILNISLFYTDESQLCVTFLSDPNDPGNTLASGGYFWTMNISLTTAPQIQTIALTSNDPIMAVPATYEAYTQLTFFATPINQNIEINIYYNTDFNPSPPSNYFFVYASGELTNFLAIYVDGNGNPYQTTTTNAITILFPKDYTPTSAIQIVTRIPEIHGRNCKNAQNLLPIYPVDDPVLYSLSSDSTGPCVLSLVTPYTQEIKIELNHIESTSNTSTAAFLLPSIHSVPPAVFFENFETTAQENVQGYTNEFPLFGFNKNENGEWDGVVLYGNLISILIPANENVDFNVTALTVPLNFTDVNGTKKGVISSSDYPNNSLFQNTTKSVGCAFMDGRPEIGRFNVTIVYADVPDDSTFSLIANTFQIPTLIFSHSNTTITNQTNIVFNASSMNAIYVMSTTPNQGFLLNYEAMCDFEGNGPTGHPHLTSSTVLTPTKKSKNQSYIWIIVLVLVLFLLLATIAAFLYVFINRRREKQRTKFLETRLESQRRESKSKHEDIVLKHNYDDYIINETKLKINYERPIGKGSSSTVYRGHLSGLSPLSKMHKSLDTQRFKDCDVAVKAAVCLGFDEVDQLYREIDVMKQIGYHKHITSMLGWYLHGETPCLIIELADRDLLSYLRELNEKPNEEMPYKELISMLWQVSRGMEYIASLRLVHRDLAARNILLSNSNIAKISDFGLCCTCDDSFTYQASIHKKLPMKWLSLEAINDRRFSEKSDVWSFGILMYEVFSRGKVPYSNMTIMEMIEFLKSGQRLECPRDANEEVYSTMLLCWDICPDLRPKFEDLDHGFREILEKETEVYGYLT